MIRNLIIMNIQSSTRPNIALLWSTYIIHSTYRTCPIWKWFQDLSERDLRNEKHTRYTNEHRYKFTESLLPGFAVGKQPTKPRSYVFIHSKSERTYVGNTATAPIYRKPPATKGITYERCKPQGAAEHHEVVKTDQVCNLQCSSQKPSSILVTSVEMDAKEERKIH